MPMMNIDEKTNFDEQALVDQIPEGRVLTEPDVKNLAHLPLLTVFYLSMQKQVSSTPVTALELAAYLGLEVRVAEGLFEYLEKRGWVRAFKEDIPAYSLGRELNEITAKDLMEILGEFHEVLKREGLKPKILKTTESNEKYRKIYSELASEIIQLFGEEAANEMPV